ncbi:ATP-binding protein [Streptomyces olivaceus]|uniref:ATP-binding protein n=1 Tax=Streptomyces olivaceus TaxID=47716 RepID=UPI0036EEA935
MPVTMAPERNNEAPEAKAWRWSAVEGSAPLSRHVLKKWLASVEATQHEETASLLFSELFSNAMRYPAPDNLVPTRWFRLGGFIRIEVDDASVYEPVVSDPGPEAESGRGLILVHLLADKWGCRYRCFNDGHGNYLNGKTVWFELHD